MYEIDVNFYLEDDGIGVGYIMKDHKLNSEEEVSLERRTKFYDNDDNL